MPWRKTLYPCLPQEVVNALCRQEESCLTRLEEIRAYAGSALELVAEGKTVRLPLIMDTARMEGLLAALSGYALYRCERELAQGYLPVGGGHRAGVCGRMVLEDGTWRMGEVTSLCLRISRHVPGAGAPVYRHLLHTAGSVRRVLFLGIPGSGKTTVLRDVALYLAEAFGLRVAAADEREELFSPDVSRRVDVLSGMDKAQSIMLLLRSMAPQAIVTDEIGRPEDAHAIEEITRCGVGLLTSAHAGSLAECMDRPVLRRLMEERVFDRYVLLKRQAGRSFFRIWDESGRQLGDEEGMCNDKPGCGGDGHDRHQRGGVFDIGRRTAPRALDPGDAALPAADARHHPLRTAGAWPAAAPH